MVARSLENRPYLMGGSSPCTPWTLLGSSSAWKHPGAYVLTNIVEMIVFLQIPGWLTEQVKPFVTAGLPALRALADRAGLQGRHIVEDRGSGPMSRGRVYLFMLNTRIVPEDLHQTILTPSSISIKAPAIEDIDCPFQHGYIIPAPPQEAAINEQIIIDPKSHFAQMYVFEY